MSFTNKADTSPTPNAIRVSNAGPILLVFWLTPLPRAHWPPLRDNRCRKHREQGQQELRGKLQFDKQDVQSFSDGEKYTSRRASRDEATCAHVSPLRASAPPPEGAARSPAGRRRNRSALVRAGRPVAAPAAARVAAPASLRQPPPLINSERMHDELSQNNTYMRKHEERCDGR